jgi:hypothetical protein
MHYAGRICCTVAAVGRCAGVDFWGRVQTELDHHRFCRLVDSFGHRCTELERRTRREKRLGYAGLVWRAGDDGIQLNELGVIEWFSGAIQDGIVSTGLSWPASTAILVLVFLYSHYFFASTTAHITAMMGAFLVVGLSLGAPPMAFVLMMAATSSIMMTLTHYATGTSPVIFGSGYVELGEWWKAGFVMSVVNLAVWVVVGGVWWKILGYW